MTEPENESGSAAVPRGYSHRFTIILAICAILTIAGSVVWRGIDFSQGVALGCLIVGLNFLWTRSVVIGALRDGKFKSRVAISYLAKFALTVVVLFLAITRFGLDPVAILVGVSSLLLAVVALIALRTAT